jgi:predicted glutamine amidotransferase
MCRLFAIKTKNKKNLITALKAFRNLDICGNLPKTVTGGHRDGFGVVFYKDAQVLKSFKTCASSSQSSLFEEVLNFANKENFDFLVAHIRKATIGVANEKNLHPFIINNISFAHNGTIKSFEESVDKDILEKRQGETDSELIFLTFLKQKGNDFNQLDINSFFKKQANKFFIENDNNMNLSLSNILSDGEKVYITRFFNEKYSQVQKLDLINYYTLYISDLSDGFVVCSEELLNTNDLENEELIWKLIENSQTVYK